MSSEFRQVNVRVTVVFVPLNTASRFQLTQQPVDVIKVDVIVVRQAIAFDVPSVTVKPCMFVGEVPQTHVKQPRVTADTGRKFPVSPELRFR
jgi:hypothetical protein